MNWFHNANEFIGDVDNILRVASNLEDLAKAIIKEIVDNNFVATGQHTNDSLFIRMSNSLHDFVLPCMAPVLGQEPSAFGERCHTPDEGVLEQEEESVGVCLAVEN